MAHTMLRLEDVIERIPDLAAGTLRGWGRRSCPPLNRLVYTEPDPARQGWKLYSFEDAQEAHNIISNLPEVPPDEFEDDRGGRWVLADKSRWHLNTLRQWCKEGCPALWGKKLKEEHVLARSGIERWYVSKDQLNEIKEFFRNPPKPESGWVHTEEATRHFNINFLLRFAEVVEGLQGPTKSSKGESHPLLNRQIKRKAWPLVRGRQVVWVSLWWWNDLETLSKDPSVSTWLTPAQSKDIHNLTDNQYQHLKKHATAKQRPLLSVRGRRPTGGPIHRVHRFASEINEAVADYKERKERLADPVYTDAEGRWWPLRASADRVGVSMDQIKYWRGAAGGAGCKHLEGKLLRAKQVDSYFPSPHKRMWVYFEHDLDTIKRRMNGDMTTSVADIEVHDKLDAIHALGARTLKATQDVPYALNEVREEIVRKVELIPVNGVMMPKPKVMPRQPNHGGRPTVEQKDQQRAEMYRRMVRDWNESRAAGRSMKEFQLHANQEMTYGRKISKGTVDAAIKWVNRHPQTLAPKP